MIGIPKPQPAEPFDHKKRAHTALIHKNIFSRPYAVFTAIRIAVYNFTFFTVSTAIQRFSTAKCALFHGQILFSRPYLDSKAKLIFRSHLAKRPLASFFAIKRPPRNTFTIHDVRVERPKEASTVLPARTLLHGLASTKSGIPRSNSLTHEINTALVLPASITAGKAVVEGA